MFFKSPSPLVEIPNISWPEYFLQRIEPLQEQVALIDADTNRQISYAELKQHIHSIAKTLQSKGYKKGDVFAIYAPNVIDYASTFQAILLLGGTVTTTNPIYTANELKQQLNHSKAVCLFTTSALLIKVHSIIEATAIQEIFDFDDINSFGTLLLDISGEVFAAESIDPGNDIAILPYSSGTTGLPKGVMLSHRNLVAHNIQFEAQKDTTYPDNKDHLIACLPFFHIYGITVIMNLGLCNGSTLLIVNGFKPKQFLGLIQQYQVRKAYLVPPVILFLAENPLVDNYDMSSMQYIMSGAAPLGEDQVLELRERISCTVCQGYGLTETSPVTHKEPDLLNTKLGSVGVLLPNTEAMIIDTETGKPLGFNETGELLLRGPQVMLGYLDNPEATTATLDVNGWLHTGDLARVDQDGFFYIVDRLKELIKCNSYQVAPAELEALLLSHPAVTDAAVVPKPDKKAGEVPKAFVVVKQDISADELISWAAKQVASYKRIKEIEFIDQIPKSPSGKILRRILRDR